MKILETIHSSVRPVVTYALAAALIAGFFIGKIPPDVFSSLVISVVSYWFGSRERNVPDGALPIVAATSDAELTIHSATTKEAEAMT